MKRLRLKNQYTCISACKGGITLLRSPELRRSLFDDIQPGTDNSDENVAIIGGLCDGRIALFYESNARESSIVCETIASLDSSCAGIASDGVSTFCAVGVEGQLIEVVLKERKTTWTKDNATTTWETGERATACCTKDSQIFVGFENAKLSQYTSSCPVAVWQSANKISVEKLVTRDRNTLIAAGMDGLLLFDIRENGKASMRLPHSTGYSCVAVDKSMPNSIVAGTFEGMLVMYDLRKQIKTVSERRHDDMVCGIMFGETISKPIYSYGRDGNVLGNDGVLLSISTPISGGATMNGRNEVFYFALENGTVSSYHREPTSTILRNRPALQLPKVEDIEYS